MHKDDVRSKKILILGGYGTFGTRISKTLAQLNLPIIIAGRNKTSAVSLRNIIEQQHVHAKVEIAIFDVDKSLSEQLEYLKPYVVINTCGPFQFKHYAVAEICITHAIHYIDLSDGRNFVTQITALDAKAKANKVAVISGASTVPGLSSAVLDHFKSQFKHINSLVYGITPGQKTARGLATTQAVLSYLGRPIKGNSERYKMEYGWQQLYRQNYPDLGKRWMASCEIPDLDLLPAKYGIQRIQFSAGMESSILHIGMWLTSWLVRLKIPIKLVHHAKFLLNLSHWFDRFGTVDGGMHMVMKGIDHQNRDKTIEWFIIAKQGHGPQIPITPAVIIAKKICQGVPTSWVGAQACVSLVTLEDYLQALSGFDIETYVKEYP